MDTQKIDLFIMSNVKNFESFQLQMLREKLSSMDESKWNLISTIGFKDPTTSLILSIFLGSLGIDRFYVGDIGIGVGKLITCGGLGIWTIIDWFLIQKATRQKNMEHMMTII